MGEYIDFIKDVFTAAQWSALLFIIAGVMALTQAFKKIYFGFKPERRARKKTALIWLAAVILGAGGSYIGSLIGIPKQPDWFWVVAGSISGAGAIGAFKLLIEVIWPKIKSRGIENA